MQDNERESYPLFYNNFSNNCTEVLEAYRLPIVFQSFVQAALLAALMNGVCNRGLLGVPKHGRCLDPWQVFNSATENK